jgi:hypothetical protein
MLARDKRDEQLANMTIAERVEFEQQMARTQPARSSFDDLPVIRMRAERKAAREAAREAEAAAPPPDPVEMARRLEAMDRRVAVLEQEAEERRQQALPALYRMKR